MPSLFCIVKCAYSIRARELLPAYALGNRGVFAVMQKAGKYQESVQNREKTANKGRKYRRMFITENIR